MNRFACLMAIVVMSLWCAGCGSNSESTDGQSSDSENAAQGEQVDVAAAEELVVPPADETAAEPDDDRPEPVARPSLLLKFMTDPLNDAMDAQLEALPGPAQMLVPRSGGSRPGGGESSSPSREN